MICTLTAITFLTTFDLDALRGTEDDSTMAMEMFSSNFGSFGIAVFSVILPLFAFTTVLAWAYYGEKAVEFCFARLGKKGVRISVIIFKALFLLLIVASSVIESQLIWDIDDTFNGLMSVPNLICLIGLSGLVVQITRNYFDRKSGKDVEPMLSAYPELNEEFKEDILSENANMR